MKNCLANKQILNIFLLITLAAFLVLPKICLADNFDNIDLEEMGKYLELPSEDAQKLIDTLRQVLTTEGILLWSSGDITDEKTAAGVILLNVVRVEILNHLLVDAPIEITWKIIKSAVEVARLYLSDDVSVILEKFEKESVQRAVGYGMNALLQKEIRVTPGAIKFKYPSKYSGQKEVIFQYVIIYKPIDIKIGKAEIRFYLPDSIDPPDPDKFSKFLQVPDLQHNLSPFIVEINGMVEKNEFGNYRWINEIGETSHPSVNITFSPTVPDLGIKPLTFWEKYVLKPIESKIKEIEIIITKVTGKSLNLVEIWDKAKSFFSKLNPFGPAAIVQTLAPSAPAQVNQAATSPILEKPLEKLTEPLTEVRPLLTPSSASPTTPKPSVTKPLTLAEIQEQLDDIAEKIDILNQEVAKFTAVHAVTPQVAGATDEFAGGPRPEELEEAPTTSTPDSEIPTPQVTFLPYIPAGSSPVTTLPQIFISEVATGWDKSDNEFIEIYNPNDFQVTLSSQNFQLKLVNSSNIVTEKRIDFDRYVIPPKSYFLFVAGEIKKEETTIAPDATYADQLTDVSGVIIMDCEDSIKDRVSWGKPEKQPPFEATEWSGVILDQGLKTGKSLERKKDAEGNYIDTDDNSQDFQISPNPNPTNSQGITLYYDSTFPETTLDENSLPADPTFSTEANFIFTSSEEDSTFQCSLDNGEWENCSSPKKYSNLSADSHQFQVRATDPAENIDSTPASYSWQIESPPQINPLDVVINEIMYDPFSGSDSYCEYLELYNDSPIDIDLADWKLISNNDQVLSADILHEGSSTVIKSGGYAIIGDQAEGDEHLYDFNTCQYNVPSYSENAIRLQIDDAGLGLNNSGMTITLKNSQNETIDEVSYQSSWGGGGNSGKSLEKVKPSAFSDQEPRNWKEGPAGGTPNAQNSNFNLNFPTSVPSNYQISQDTFWSLKSSPYLIRNATVLEGVTLTIEPGVVIKFYDYNSGLTINGTLKAVGQDADKIVFTSFKDDEYGGDSNGDGNASLPQPGSWKQIYFTPTGQNSELNYVIVRYGGEFYQTWPPCFSERATIKVERSSILLKNSILEKNKSRGLWLINSSSVIENSQFLDHQVDCRPLPDNQTVALLIQEGNPIIENCQFEKNIYGIRIEGDSQNFGDNFLIKNNNFRENNYPIHTLYLSPVFEENITENNKFNGIFASIGNLNNDATLFTGLPYILPSTLDIQPNITLTINPGAIIKFFTDLWGSLIVNGNLVAQGTSENPIVFTSIKDDEYGDDTNNDGDSTLPALGNWKEIKILGTANLDWLKIRYANSNPPSPLNIQEGASVTQNNISIEP